MPRTYDLTPSDIALYQRSVEYLSRLNDLDPYSGEYRDVYNDYLDTIDQISNRDFKASLRPTVAEFAPLVRPQVQRAQVQPQTPSRTAELNKAQATLNNSPQLREEIFGSLPKNVQQPEQLSPLDAFELQLLSGEFDPVISNRTEKAPLNKSLPSTAPTNTLQDRVIKSPYSDAPNPVQEAVVDRLVKNNSVDLNQRKEPDTADRFQDAIFEAIYPTSKENLQDAVVNSMINTSSPQTEEISPEGPESLNDRIFDAIYPNTTSQTPQESIKPLITNNLQLPQYRYFSPPLLGKLPYSYQLAILSSLLNKKAPSQKESQEKSSISLSDFPIATPQITYPKWYY